MVTSPTSSREGTPSSRALTPGSILIIATSVMLLAYVLVLYRPWQFLGMKFTLFTALLLAQPVIAFLALVFGIVCLLWWWKVGRTMSFIVLGVAGGNFLLWIVQAVLGVKGGTSLDAVDILLYLLQEIFPPLVLTGGIALGALLNVLEVGTPQPVQPTLSDADAAVATGVPSSPASPYPAPPVPSPPVPPPRSPMPKAWLHIRAQGAQISTVPVRDGLLIGRAQEADVLLTHSSVSRRHAVIRYAQGRFFIQDQGSANGTYVNNRRVSATALKDGDLIRVGTVELIFRQE